MCMQGGKETFRQKYYTLNFRCHCAAVVLSVDNDSFVSLLVPTLVSLAVSSPSLPMLSSTLSFFFLCLFISSISESDPLSLEDALLSCLWRCFFCFLRFFLLPFRQHTHKVPALKIEHLSLKKYLSVSVWFWVTVRGGVRWTRLVQAKRMHTQAQPVDIINFPAIAYSGDRLTLLRLRDLSLPRLFFIFFFCAQHKELLKLSNYRTTQYYSYRLAQFSIIITWYIGTCMEL